MTQTAPARALPLALAAACMLSACSKSPQEMGCDDAQVQTDVRKLLAIKLEKWQEPISPVSWSREQMRRQNPELEATLTGLKAKSARIEHISLAEVREVAKPQSPLLDADPPQASLRLPESLRPKETGNKLLYQCTCTVKMTLPQERLASIPQGNLALLGIDQNTLTAAVTFQTELTPEGNMWVAASLSNPLAEIALRAMLAQREPQTAQE